MATGLGSLAEIAKQLLAAAIQRLGKAQKGVQPGMVGGAAFRRGEPLVDLRAAQADVVGAEKRQRFRWSAIAPGAADLLVIGLDALGQVGVSDPADIGLVHAHAEGDGGHHDQPVLAGKPRLDYAPIFGLHPAVIMAGVVAFLGQRLRQSFGLGTGPAVDDAGLPLAGGGKAQDLLARAGLGAKGKMDVRAVKAAQKGVGLFAIEQLLDDLSLGFRVRRRGKGRDRHAQRLPQFPDAQVVGAEVMAPLADAMGLVHRDEADTDPPQHGHRGAGGKPLGREVEQLQIARLERGPDGVVLFRRVARGKRTGAHTGLLQGADLVAHQCDQRRDHQRHAAAQQCGQLVAERLAPARGHDGQHVAPRGHRFDDFALSGAERIESEDIAQQRLRV